MTTPRLVFGSLALMMAIACEQIIDAQFGEGKPFGATEAEIDGSAEASSSRSCDSVLPPARPDIPPATDQLEFTVVIRAVDYGDLEDETGQTTHRSIGFDLDGTCTTSEKLNCQPPSWVETDITDGPRGQDNAVGRLLAGQTESFGNKLISSDALNQNVADGINAPGAVLRVRNFGGLAEDDRVEVDWFVPAPPAGGDAETSAPAFDDTDRWPISSDTVADPTAPSASDTVSRFRTTEAFVTARTLVARFDATRLPLLNVYFRLTEIVLVATTVRDPATGQWTLEDGTFAGRAEANDLLRVVPQIALQSFGVPVCTDNAANYPPIKSFVCTAADLLSDGPVDPEAPCTHTSVGVRFETSPASLGELVSPAPIPATCPPETDPAKDTCDDPPANTE